MKKRGRKKERNKGRKEERKKKRQKESSNKREGPWAETMVRGGKGEAWLNAYFFHAPHIKKIIPCIQYERKIIRMKIWKYEEKRI